MDLRHLVVLALQVSIIVTVFGFGLRTTPADLLALVRRPSLLARALLTMFVVMPLVAVALVEIFDFAHTVEIVLLALAISPVPPLLPTRGIRAGGDASFSLGLMAIVALLAIAIVPLEVALLGRYFGRGLAIGPGAIAAIVLKAALAPLTAGMAVRTWLPAVAERIEALVARLGKGLLLIGALVLLAGTASAIWAYAGPGTILAMALFIVAGLAIGHVLGGPDPDHAVVLALCTACRHPAIALTIAATNFPDQHFGPVVLLYVLVNAIIGLPYVLWLKSAARTRVAPATSR